MPHARRSASNRRLIERGVSRIPVSLRICGSCAAAFARYLQSDAVSTLTQRRPRVPVPAVCSHACRRLEMRRRVRLATAASIEVALPSADAPDVGAENAAMITSGRRLPNNADDRRAAVVAGRPYPADVGVVILPQRPATNTSTPDRHAHEQPVDREVVRDPDLEPVLPGEALEPARRARRTPSRRCRQRSAYVTPRPGSLRGSKPASHIRSMKSQSP